MGPVASNTDTATGTDTSSDLVAGSAPMTAAGPSRSSPSRRAAFEREEAVLDLADGAQASTRAAMMADQGGRAESDRLDHEAHQLYECADDHRRLADQLCRRRPTGTVTRSGLGH